jgi:hypothetical protein
MRYQKPYLYLGADNFRVGEDFYDDGDFTPDVLSDFQDHKKVLKFDGNCYDRAYKDFGVTEETGTVEAYFAADDVSGAGIGFVLMGNAGAVGVLVGFVAGKLSVASDGGFTIIDVIDPAVNDTWYHLKIEFDCTSDTFDLWVDGVQYYKNPAEDPFDFVLALDNVSTIGVYFAGASGVVYLDAVDYSWATGYFNNRNKGIFSNIINRYNVKPIIENPSSITC